MVGMPQERPMGSPRIPTVIYCALLASWVGTPAYPQLPSGTSTKQEQPPAGKSASDMDPQAGVPALQRGKKPVLKDGTFQFVRDYRRYRELVRYLSRERDDRGEVPAYMADV